MDDFLREVVTGWTIEALDSYIGQLETRVGETNKLIRELRALRRHKDAKTKKPVDTGARDGR